MLFETMEAPPFRTVWVFSEYGTTLLLQNIAVDQICFVPGPKWVCSRAAFGVSQGPDPGQPMMHTAEPNNSPARFGPLFSPKSLYFLVFQLSWAGQVLAGLPCCVSCLTTR